jgi:dTDP-4-dehydrorhamnose 3,5-epimerase
MPELIPSSVIDDVVLVRPDVHGDERGRFVETYRRSWFPDRPEMIQGNRLHQADYWYALRGKVRVVLHDLRVGSRTDGATEVIELDGNVDQGVYIPPGVAHGFVALTDILLTYLVDNYYDDSDEHGLAWDDPIVAAHWGVTDPILSNRDQNNPWRDDIPEEIRPKLAS